MAFRRNGWRRKDYESESDILSHQQQQRFNAVILKWDDVTLYFAQMLALFSLLDAAVSGFISSFFATDMATIFFPSN